MFYYISKDSLTNGSDVTIIFQTESAIPNYKQITNFGELVEYQGDNIPNQWEFDGAYFYALSDKPSPYHKLNENKEWVVFDMDGFKAYCLTRIDEIKAEILEYGFDYEIDGKTHRQRCRDKDITFMGTTMTFLIGEKLTTGKDETAYWYFEDNYEYKVNLTTLTVFAKYGKTFMDAVYKAENYFKTLEEPKLITKDEYLQKIKELQKAVLEG